MKPDRIDEINEDDEKVNDAGSSGDSVIDALKELWSQ